MPAEVPVKLAAVVVVLPPLLAAGLVYDLCWAAKHRHLYGHAGGEVE